MCNTHVINTCNLTEIELWCETISLEFEDNSWYTECCFNINFKIEPI